VGARVEVGRTAMRDEVDVGNGGGGLMDGATVAGGGKCVAVLGTSEGGCPRLVQPVTSRMPMMTTAKPKWLIVSLEIIRVIAANLLSMVYRAPNQNLIHQYIHPK